jgi:PAS domain S-box-containing protein
MTIAIDLIYNLALLVALSIVSGFIDNRWSKNTFPGPIIQGFLFGSIAIIGMLRPLTAIPGLIFDGRSVVISLCGLFFGPLAAIISCSMAILCRWFQGGIGSFMGISVILSSGLIGCVYNFRRQQIGYSLSPLTLYIFGVIVHIAMLLLMFTLPYEIAIKIITSIGLPVIITYPLATVLIGKILSDQVIRNNFIRSLLKEIQDRQKAESALREREEQFRVMFDLASVGMAQADPQTGRWLRVNQKLCAITGYTADELLGMHFTEITHPEDRQHDWEAFQEVVRGEAAEYHNEKRYIRKDGAVVWVNVNVTLCKDSSGQPHFSLAVIEDITARHQAEEALQWSEERFRQMAETVGEVFWLSEPASQSILYVSPAFEHIWGRPCAELYANPRLWLQGIHPEDVQMVLTSVENLDKGVPKDIVYRVIRPDGSQRWINDRGYALRGDDGEVILLSGVASDITARRQAETALRASEEKFRLAMAAIEEGIWDWHPATGELYITPGFLRTHGYDPRALEPSYDAWAAAIHPEDLPSYQEALEAHLAGRRPFFEAEFRGRLANGQYRWFSCRGRVMDRAADGRPRRMVGAVRDINEKKLAQTALEESLSLYQATLESTTDGLLALDLAGRIVSWNRKYTDMWQIPEDLMKSREQRPVWAYAADQLQDPEGAIARSEEIFADITAESYDLLLLKDGRVFERYSIPQYLNNRIVGRVLSFRDVTARVQAEAALKESEAGYRRIVETANEGIWAMDANFHTTFVNRQMAAMLSLEPEAMVGKQMTDFLFPEDLADHQTKMQHRRQGLDESYERRFRRQDGEELWTIVSVRALKGEAGEFTGSLAMFTDITERKRMEEELRQSERRVKAKLDSILSPEGDIGQLDLEDIIDVPAIQSLMSHFYLLTHLPLFLIDLKGKVLVGVGWQDLCTKFHRVHPESCRRCVESDTVLSGDVPPGTFKLYKCKNQMWDLVTPVMVGGKHAGNLFMGQFLFADEEPDYEVFCAQAREFGFDEEAYLAALAQVPRMDRQKVDQAMAFFTRLAQMISLLSLSNLRLARAVSEQERLVGSLQVSEEQLRVSLQEKEVMLKEIHHRVKNNMQMISTLFDLQLKYGGDQAPPTLFRDCQNRIRSMALIHESLYHTDTLANINFRGYLEKLVRRLLTSFGSSLQGISASVTGAEVHLGIDQAVPAGLVASELLMNCMKHAFPGQRSGEILISLEVLEVKRVLEIKDNGIGLQGDLDLETPTTFGWLIISNLVKQLGGTITVTCNGGTTCRIIF